MLTHLLDTSVYSQRLRPRPVPQVVVRWQECGDSALAISAICESELLYGLEKRNSDRLWREYRDFLEDRLALLAVDKQVAARFGRLKAEQEQLGEPRAEFDLLIAATALAHNLIVATLNPRHFEGLSGLVVEDWSK